MFRENFNSIGWAVLEIRLYQKSRWWKHPFFQDFLWNAYKKSKHQYFLKWLATEFITLSRLQHLLNRATSDDLNWEGSVVAYFNWLISYISYISFVIFMIDSIEKKHPHPHQRQNKNSVNPTKRFYTSGKYPFFIPFSADYF